jgi:hypothetical protein
MTLAIGYDRDAVRAAITKHNEFISLADLFAELPKRDGTPEKRYDAEKEERSLAYSLIREMNSMLGWTCTAPGQRADVYADYSCDGDGFTSNDGYLTLVACVDGVIVGGPSFASFLDLPDYDQDGADLLTLLDAIVAYLNERIVNLLRIAHAIPAAG